MFEFIIKSIKKFMSFSKKKFFIFKDKYFGMKHKIVTHRVRCFDVNYLQNKIIRNH